MCCSTLLFALFQYQVNARDIAHVITPTIFMSGLRDMFAGLCFIAESFAIEAEIWMSVQEPPPKFRRGGVVSIGSSQDIVRFGFSCKERVNLHHRHPRILVNWD